MTPKETSDDKSLTLNAACRMEDVARLARGYKTVQIDCGVMALEGETLNEMMKIARGEGVDHFVLQNVCGQTLIGTGIKGNARIDVHGLMGNHSAAFMDNIELNTYATTFPNGVWCPGDAQVAIGNTANPTEMNIGGSVDDLFASYCPSGIFRVAGQGGNRCVLRGGAGVPHVWREIDYSDFANFSEKDTREYLLNKYQKRRAKILSVGWNSFLSEFKQKVEDRDPPVIVFGRKVRDYFMEYAQGTIGVLLNLFDIPNPAGYYICSGMTAGTAYIRAEFGEERLGERVMFAKISEEDSIFLKKTIFDFHKTFFDRMDDTYRARIDKLSEACEKDNSAVVSQFKKITPVG